MAARRRPETRTLSVPPNRMRPWGLGWIVAEVFSDNDLSAYSGTLRSRYRAMLDAIRAGRINAVLAWHTDRLHRSPIELEDYISACNDGRDVLTHTATAGPLDLSSPSGRMLGTLARYESEHRGEWVAAALQRARAGRRSGGPRPFGYEDDGVTVREPEAAAVRDAVESVLAGGGGDLDRPVPAHHHLRRSGEVAGFRALPVRGV
ncbi:MAG: recombinase family protein [Pseudonocardiaceae bacterium]